MGRPTVTRRFPLYFLGILDRLKTEDMVSMDFGTKKEANNFRLDFLAFRNAAIREGMDQPKKIEPINGFHEVEFLEAEYPMLNAYKTKIHEAENGVWWVDMYDMDKSPEALEISRKLGM